MDNTQTKCLEVYNSGTLCIYLLVHCFTEGVGGGWEQFRSGPVLCGFLGISCNEECVVLPRHIGFISI